MTRTARLLLVSTLFLSGCGATNVSTQPATTSLQTTTSPQTTSSRVEVATEGLTLDGDVLLGAYVEPRNGFGDENRRKAVLDHEAIIGRQLGLVNEFFAFDKTWNLDRMQWHLDSGRELMISWNGAPADHILSGAADETIRQRAIWTRDFDRTIVLRFFWEPDASKGDTWGYHDDPSLYHDVWRYVRAIFAEENAQNVLWAWTPTAWHFASGDAPAFYPGDDLVDIIGADGYLWSPCQGEVESADEVFGAFMTWAENRPQPILVAEWGADADPSSDSKADFVDQMLELARDSDRIFGLVVFDAVDPGGRGCDWRIDSSSDALESYRRLAADPMFAPSASTVTDP